MRFRIVLACVLVAVLTGVVVAAPASAAPATAAWGIASVAYPTDFTAEGNAACSTEALAYRQCDKLAVTATNVGAKPTSEKAVTLSDTVPAGLTVQRVELFWDVSRFLNQDLLEEADATCVETPASGGGTLVKCTLPITFFAGQSEPYRHISPNGPLKMVIFVTVNEPATPKVLVNKASVSGGGIATEASTSAQNTLDEGTPGFGPSLFTAPLVGANGLAEDQAGTHPYELRTTFGLNNVVREDPQATVVATTVEDPRDIVVDLPSGVAGSGVSAAQCTLARLSSRGEKAEQGRSGCPADTVVGHIRTYPESNVVENGPIYNLIPEHGYAAEFGFIDATGGTHVLYVSLAPTPAGYVLRTTGREIPAIALTEIIASVYGDPAASDRAQESAEAGGPYTYAIKSTDTPTFTNPENCDGEPLVTTVYMDSWQHPGSYNTDGTPDVSDSKWVQSTFESSPPVTGCEALAGLFNPTLEAHADTVAADSPTGFDVNLKVPQSTGTEKLGTPPVKDTVVSLPEGMTVNPSSANGLEACSEAQIGWQGTTPAAGESELEDFNAAVPACPDASKIGTVELETPALPSEACKEPTVPLQECPNASEREKTPLTGSIYVAKQTENPFASLLAIYIVVNDPRTGVVVKIPAKVEADPNTGRLTTVVDDTPQFPFSELRTHFYGGDTAALKTPATCGTYTVGSTITPWSAPQSGPPSTPSGSFEVTQGPGGGACGALGFAPSFTAGTATSNAGGFSPLSVSFSRNDGEQGLAGASVTMPPGVSAILSGVPLCGEPQAAEGDCGEGSLIGEATTAVGAGPAPYWVHGGKVYLTGAYNNGSFGLSIVVPTTAGPYTLTGNAGPGKEVVRASLRINPVTAQVTTVSDPLPTILQGIPLDIRSVNVTVNRPGFVFNPTSCNPMSATGTLTSTTGASVPVANRFQAGGCTSLGFKPKFSVATAGRTSRQNGASLKVKLVYPSAPFGSQANIAKVKVDLPKQLPSRLNTLNHACPNATFEQNPASCPAESKVGTATATTPLLPVALSGPAYFVSYGGAKFPELIVVLQGYGVTVDLHGETFINEKTNITSSTFNTVPDVPVGTFELTLPQGKYSALAANANLCSLTKTTTTKKKIVVKSKGHHKTITRTTKTTTPTSLQMPTMFTAQNGTTIKQNTPITITGCPKTKPKTKKAKAKKKHG
jgi:hypothetical protein